jgi:hypothetical protein
MGLKLSEIYDWVVQFLSNIRIIILTYVMGMTLGMIFGAVLMFEPSKSRYDQEEVVIPKTVKSLATPKES